MNANKVLEKLYEAISSGNSSDEETLGEKSARNKATAHLSSDDEPLLLKSLRETAAKVTKISAAKKLAFDDERKAATNTFAKQQSYEKKIQEENLAEQNLSLQPLSLQDHLAAPIIQAKPTAFQEYLRTLTIPKQNTR